MDDYSDIGSIDVGGYSISAGLDPSQLAIPGQIGGDMEAASQNQMPGAGSDAMGGMGARQNNASWLGSLFGTSSAPPLGPNGLSNPTAPGSVYDGAGAGGSGTGPSMTMILIIAAIAYVLFKRA